MRVVHPARGPASYVLTIYCDDPSHDIRTITTLGYWPTPPGSHGFLNWLEAEHADPEQPPSLQTPFGEARKRWKVGVSDDPFALPEGMDWEYRWRFECRGCRTLPVNGRRMDAILEKLREHGVPRISLPQIAASL